MTQDEHTAAALQCIQVARKAFQEGDREKALRFVEKSLRLHETPQGLQLRRQLLGPEAEPEESGANSGAEDSAAGGAGAAGGSPRGAANGHGHANGATGTSGARKSHDEAHGHGGAHRGEGAGARAGPGPGSAAGGAGGAAAGPDREDSTRSQATPEMVQLVNRIRGTKNYYEILSVAKGATDDDIKKGYRKLALKLHPDKNRAPGAEEAFKSVSRAFHCLSTPDLRANYDRYGHEKGAAAAAAAAQAAQQAARGGGQVHRRGPRQQMGMRFGNQTYYVDEDDFDPELLFRTFFGGDPFLAAAFGGPAMHQHLRRRAQRARRPSSSSSEGAPQGGGAPWASLLVRLLPVLFLLLNTPFLAMIFGGGGPEWSFEASHGHPYPVESQRYKVKYFVDDLREYTEKYPPRSQKRLKFEQKVESEHYSALQQGCVRERSQHAAYKRWGMTPPEDFRAVSCEELHRVYGVRGAGDGMLY